MNSPIRWSTFLYDVLQCSLGAYGGPEAHYGVFTHQLVSNKHYLTEEELTELIALTAIIPGPSSTQTIVAIGYKVGGPMLAFLTMLVWGLPVIFVMTALSFMYQYFAEHELSTDIIRFIGPMAVGFIFVAAYRLGLKVVKTPLHIVLFSVAISVTFFYRAVWVFPSLLGLGALVAILTTREKNLWYHVQVTPPYRYLVAFATIAIGAFALTYVVDSQLLWLFERFYRYGYLIIGGGQVVVPYMYNDLVEVFGFMTTDEFLSGFGLVQGLPGPMFSFSAYAGGLAASGSTILVQIAGGLLSALGIFLPGILLIYFIYPMWEQLRTIKGIKVALGGIGVVAAGLITSAGLVLLRDHGLNVETIVAIVITILALLSKKIPAPLLVFLALLAGWLIPTYN